MAPFEGGTAVPPSATDPASGTFMWPVFNAVMAASTAGVTGNVTPTSQISSTTDEYKRKKTRG